MVKELRKIILDREDFVTAMESYKRTNFDFLPPGKVASCELRANEPVVVNMEAITGSKSERTDFSFKPPDLLEPMIKFCIENNIILPRNSRKSVLIGDDQAVLFIQINSLEMM